MTNGAAEAIPRVDLFTDGACSGNPGPGGWAFILRDRVSGREKVGAGGERSTTNNRMELLAVINGLERLKKRSRVDLHSDSQYVVNGLQTWLDDWIKKGWRKADNKPVMNLELWQRLDELRRQHEIKPIWVRGHNEHIENERCDQLAVEAAERFRT